MQWWNLQVMIPQYHSIQGCGEDQKFENNLSQKCIELYLLLPTQSLYHMQVKSVKIKAGKHTHNSCGIDGELFPLNGQVISSLLPEQCRLIGRSHDHHV